MWQSLRLRKVKPVDETACLPPMVTPFVDAANRGEGLAPHVASITKCFGFDNFMYGVSASPQSNAETRTHLYTDEGIIKRGQLPDPREAAPTHS